MAATTFNDPQQQATQALERHCEDVETPMTHLQHSLNPWVAFAVLPTQRKPVAADPEPVASPATAAASIAASANG